MRVGIRAKMVSLLAAVAVVPLVAALITIVNGARKIQSESFGETFEAVTISEALTLSISLTAEIEKFDTLLNGSEMIVDELARRKTQLSKQRLAELDAKWERLPESARDVQSVMNNPISHRLVEYMSYREQYMTVAEIIITDRFGQLTAATGRTSDFNQADENWWVLAYNKGLGRLCVPGIAPDRSAGVEGLSFCVPIRRNQDVVGVAKIVLRLDRWVSLVREKIAGYPASMALVRVVGRAGPRLAYVRSGATPADWRGMLAVTAAGWRSVEGGRVQAYAPLEIPSTVGALELDSPQWLLVLELPGGAALESISQLTTVSITVGLIVIAGLFTLGLALVDRSIVRRIRSLEQATRQVAEGDLTHRVEVQHMGGMRLLGPDEINDLAEDFNRMVRRVEESYRALHEANEMKTNFIRVAGHELRTPVSYMLAMEHLLEHSDDPEDLRRALQAMAAKARRLDEIIQAIFKLLPTQRYSEDVRYTEVHLRELMLEIGGSVHPFTEQRSQTLGMDVPKDLPPVPADRDKLRDIIENLLMNAVKFTPDGGRVSVEVRRQLGGYIAIKVVDQGPGIPEKDLPHIFESFYSTSDVMKHSTGTSGYGKRGLGLGLAIVKHFVDLHSGDVHVTTGPEGSTFTVTLPMDPPGRSIRPQQPPS